jgi:hypothetical protein
MRNRTTSITNDKKKTGINDAGLDLKVLYYDLHFKVL